MRKMKTAVLLWVSASLALAAQQRASPAEIKQAETEVPQLAAALELRPGMTVADIGAGFGATTLVLSKWIGPTGRIYATDIVPNQLDALRELTAREQLPNVVVLEGSADSTNLPAACCDALLMRDVYHHIMRPDVFDRSAVAALKVGGRLAVIDFEPEPGSELPAGVPADRGGHGIAPNLVMNEVSAAGATYVKTMPVWPPEDTRRPSLYLVLFRKP